MLSAGTRLGPYEVLSPLGEGGMGQVYLARDGRLDRRVALKVLREDVSADASRMVRFEREARAASALNHPNIVTIYDVGTSDSISWIAMEHVEGQTLRDLLLGQALPLRRTLNLASQVADGLATAHEAGIVHRDLKPENVIVGKGDHLKILDFGLAKLAPMGSGTEGSSPNDTATFPGAVMGTVAYMSPEQARGRAIDHRSDQFSFGAVLFEMATGKRAFRRETAVDTLSAVLNEEPEPIAELNPRIPVAMRWIIERCLAKEAGGRYASTRDLAQDLRNLRERLPEISTGPPPSVPISPRRHPSLRGIAVAVAVSLMALGGAFALGRRLAPTPVPEFQRLTFRRGGILGARFAPDGRAVAYSAAWDGGPSRLYSTRTDGTESTAFGPPGLDVLAISSLGEMAVLRRDFGSPTAFLDPGTLAHLPLAGGAPREMTDGVISADWTPDGKALAISRVSENGKTRLEFPIGTTLYESDDAISNIRVSPSGDRVAFVETRRITRASVEMVDRSGRRQTVSSGWNRCYGLAWSPDGSEIWFTANEGGWRTPLRAVKPGGSPRVVLRLPSWITLQDVAPDGRVLMSVAAMRATMRATIAGDAEERDLSWHEGSLVRGLTPDGKTLLFDETSEGEFHAIYVRPTDGSPAKRIAEGRALAISPDGRWVATNAHERGSALVLVPTGSGDSKVLDAGEHRFEEAAFLPDGRHLLLAGVEPGHGEQTFLRDLESGKMQPVGAEGLECLVASPDGREIACTNGGEGGGTIVSLESGASRPVPGGLRGDETILQWSQDGRSLFVAGTNGSPSQVFRVDLSTGRRELWREFNPADRAGLLGIGPIAITPDGRSYAYSSLSVPSELYLVKGLR